MVGGYPRATAGPVRLDLNEAPHGAGVAFAKRVLELLAAQPWNRYPEIDGSAARAAAAELYGWEASGTLVGNGSNELLAALVRALLPPGGTLARLAPSFSMYSEVARRARARELEVRLDPPGFVADGAGLVEAVGQADLALLASPNNPTGGVLPVELMRRIAALDKPTVWDGAYLEFAGLDPLPLLREFPNLIVLRSLSKAWGLAGLRAGALLTAPAMAARVSEQTLPFATWWLPLAAYRAATELREAGAALVADTVAERERQLALLRQVAGVAVVPSAGNFYLLGVEGLAGQALADSLRGRGIAVRYLEDLSSSGHVRVTVGAVGEGDALLAAVREVAGR
jgi:histidinol-phosphate aminotransferase